MAKRIAIAIEVVSFIVLAFLAIRWIRNPNGDSEPWMAMVALVATSGLELYRRTFAKHEPASKRVNGQSPEDTPESLLSWLLANAPGKNLSETLPRALRLAQKLGDKGFEKWVRLELYGYKSENGMLDEDRVPEYRAIVGRYLDGYMQPLMIRDPKMAFVNEDRFRIGVRELEEYSKKSGMLYMQNEDMLSLVRTHTGFDALQFGFNPASIVGILESIRSRLLDCLHEIKDGRGMKRT